MLETKIIAVANDMGVVMDESDISVAHRIGGAMTPNKTRQVIVKFTRRKKRNEIMKKKKELKKKKKKIYVNEDLTPLRSTMLKIVKERENVKNATTRDGKILVWLNNGEEKPLDIDSPDDLWKVGIVTPDWKRLKLEQVIINQD